jgi:hypothetical protein
MKRKIEYHNELGIILTVNNGMRRVYQDILPESYTWINIWINEVLVGSIDTRQNKLIFNFLDRTKSDPLIPSATTSVKIPF